MHFPAPPLLWKTFLVWKDCQHCTLGRNSGFCPKTRSKKLQSQSKNNVQIQTIIPEIAPEIGKKDKTSKDTLSDTRSSTWPVWLKTFNASLTYIHKQKSHHTIKKNTLSGTFALEKSWKARLHYLGINVKTLFSGLCHQVLMNFLMHVYFWRKWAVASFLMHSNGYFICN